METIKSFTDLEQSKKLSEILPLESADMCYPYDRHLNKMYGDIPYVMGYKRFNEDTDFPCWSLTALLRLMPNSQNIKIDNVYYSIVSFKDKYGTSSFRTSQYDNPIDAAFEMVVWLKKNNKI